MATVMPTNIILITLLFIINTYFLSSVSVIISYEHESRYIQSPTFQCKSIIRDGDLYVDTISPSHLQQTQSLSPIYITSWSFFNTLHAFSFHSDLGSSSRTMQHSHTITVYEYGHAQIANDGPSTITAMTPYQSGAKLIATPCFLHEMSSIDHAIDTCTYFMIDPQANAQYLHGFDDANVTCTESYIISTSQPIAIINSNHKSCTSFTIHLQSQSQPASPISSLNLTQSIYALYTYSEPTQCVYIGIDDKAKVPLVIAVANEQQSILMRVEYKVKLPDHTFAVSEKHKLTPSVYGTFVINAGEIGDHNAVKQSESTFIDIRSGTHDTATTFDHELVILSMHNDETFRDSSWSVNEPKPVLIIRTDAEPDQNLRHSGTIKMYYNICMTLKLDLLLVSMSAPKASAFNENERMMAPLSNMLVGVVLEYLMIRNHLDANYKTVDEELVKQNFAALGKLLVDIGCECIIVDYPVNAVYVDPVPRDEKESKFDTYTEKFADAHFNYAHFHFSIMQCQDISCYTDYRSNTYDILQQNKYPVPRYFVSYNGILALTSKFSNLPSTAHYKSLQIY